MRLKTQENVSVDYAIIQMVINIINICLNRYGLGKSVDEYDDFINKYISYFSNMISKLVSDDITLAYQLENLSFGNKTPENMLSDLKIR